MYSSIFQLLILLAEINSWHDFSGFFLFVIILYSAACGYDIHLPNIHPTPVTNQGKTK